MPPWTTEDGEHWIMPAWTTEDGEHLDNATLDNKGWGIFASVPLSRIVITGMERFATVPLSPA